MSLTSNMENQKIFEYHDETQGDRLARKAKETPIFPIAVGVCSLAVAYGAYMFKNKGKMSTSVYLMHMRVGAQGLAVASLTAGLIYTMVNEHILKKKA